MEVEAKAMAVEAEATVQEASVAMAGKRDCTGDGGEWCGGGCGDAEGGVEVNAEAVNGVCNPGAGGDGGGGDGGRGDG